MTDPVLNGGGSFTDFGCQGANLSTWLMNGLKPEAVVAVTQHIKPHFYPKVDDVATMILTYIETQAILQVSWNRNYNRKDLEVYCKNGYVICPNRGDLKIMRSQKDAISQKAEAPDPFFNYPFSYPEVMVQGKISVSPSDLSALE